MSQMMEDTLRYDIANYRKRIAELESEKHAAEAEAGRQICLNTELEQEINQKADYNMQAFERIAELEAAMQAMRDDLLMRADEDSNGVRLVACGASAWRKFNKALEVTK